LKSEGASKQIDAIAMIVFIVDAVVALVVAVVLLLLLLLLLLLEGENPRERIRVKEIC
jgi:hypothetical protein